MIGDKMTISSFEGYFRFLSNFYPCKIKMGDGIIYPSSEHAYQAFKSKSLSERKVISRLSSPQEAKRAGKKLRAREDWEFVKLSVMESIVRIKFTTDPFLKTKLVNTGDRELIEGNWWGDTFWGVCKGIGQNNLGKILMKIRKELQ